ncbi:bifunctional methylenetetrahydrofolate dehydrogenase/methenyltetrahydrofolate cyclohydrolase [Alicyclobacillus fastidiosus]|uniref:Bifunctional protein FolD n=1 Tax=Alicyclobacillus fastidiosus TaxID=392011 RepID=A0ABY6ZQ67_9BACL|nr:tetrahydrofolate dehydrogenase/cyclohydrolase catalytic domain-containing protein [Alicyclobacillus fastidiosus]WAH44301.1 bifunctional methylenetetrahydrofolate dehydrogenase/methenyltetrahydrofolate cyclohydrolase [Alicyclobacillus fastidiosus]GMA60626.1 bifunctional protein FolD [Alicyclobacillus fastidiosus]
MARILDGKVIAAAVKQDLAMEIAQLREKEVQPKLVVVLVGDDAASASYVRSKERMARELGLEAEVIKLSADVSESELMRQIELQNADDSVDAVLVQLPLPEHIDTDWVLMGVDPTKDVDGFHPQNIGRYAIGSPLVWPCTTAGILEILERANAPVAGQTAVVVGRSRIVGWPTAQLLLAHNATVVQCHRQTRNLAEFTRQADILVVAAGQAGLIRADDVKAGAVVIDVGINRVDGHLVGDVDFDSVVQKAGAITPVPGGVGPLTVAMLMKNTVRLARIRRLTKEDER